MKALFKYIGTLLKKVLAEGGEASSMRLGILSMIPVTIAMMVMVMVYIDRNGAEVEWEGLSIFCSSYIMSFGALLGIKAFQKKYEK